MYGLFIGFESVFCEECLEVVVAEVYFFMLVVDGAAEELDASFPEGAFMRMVEPMVIEHVLRHGIGTAYIELRAFPEEKPGFVSFILGAEG